MGQEKCDPIDEKATVAIKAAIANLDMSASKFHYACSHHTGGLCVGGFASYDEAKSAADRHKRDTGHTDCYPSSGNCPF
jgi:hypothetical protein